MKVALPEWELWACADQLLRQHGEEAPAQIAERVRALALAGDASGVSTWQAIAHRLDQLTAEDGFTQ